LPVKYKGFIKSSWHSCSSW